MAVDHGAWFLVLPPPIPILVLSAGPLLYGILLAFTDPVGPHRAHPVDRCPQLPGPAPLRERLEGDGDLVLARYQR